MNGRDRDRSSRRREPRGPITEGRHSARSVLRDLAEDVGYLAFKERAGEPLTPSERAGLDAARAGSGPDREGGGP